MFYSLNDDIYVVKGAKYSCIYDLPHNKLHKISKRAYDLLVKVGSGCEIEDVMECQFLESLVSLGILKIVTKSTKNNKSIEEVFSYKRKIDFAWVELTNICNLRCIHCYNEHVHCSKVYLSLEDFKWVVNQLCSIGIEKIQLIGGEPFLINKNMLFEMMDYLSSRVKGFELFTNGTITTEEDWKAIRERYPNVSVATSLHSYLKEEHEKVTQVKDSFNKTVNTLKTLRSLKIPHRFVGTYIAGVAIGENEKIGKPSRRDFVRLSGRANLTLYDDELLKKRLISEKTLHSGDLRETLNSIYVENCFSTHLYVGANMDVYPCPMERRVCHGNLRGNNILDILKPQILEFTKNEVDGCKDCEYRYICRDCRPDSLTGNFNEKPWYCTYNPYLGVWETFEEFKNRICKYNEK